MDDKLLVTRILGLRPPWFIQKVVVDDQAQRVDSYVDHEPDIRVRCPVCDTLYGLYDHAPERVYRHLWDYRYAAHIRNYFKRWYFWATHSRLKPIRKAAQTLKVRIDNIVTYAKHRITNVLGEAINAEIEKVKHMACGFRNRAPYRTATYFHCGGLDLFPKPPTLPTLCFKSAASQYVGGTH